MESSDAGGPAARMLPDIPLRAAEGNEVRLTDYRHRKHLVLLLFAAPPGEPGGSIPDPVAARHGEFAAENAEVVAVFPALPAVPGTPGSFPFPVLEDRAGEVSRALRGNGSPGNPDLSVYVADRYGEVFRSQDVRAGVPFPADEILSWLRFLERLCPE